MILALQDDTSRHDAGRSLYGRSKARLPTGPASWPTRWGTCPIMVLTARSGRWLLPTSWPAWPAYSDQAPPEGTGGGAMLTDGAWMGLEPLIEACRPKGKTAPKDLRRTISAIVWRHQNGAKWRAIPAELGPWSRA